MLWHEWSEMEHILALGCPACAVKLKWEPGATYEEQCGESTGLGLRGSQWTGWRCVERARGSGWEEASEQDGGVVTECFCGSSQHCGYPVLLLPPCGYWTTTHTHTYTFKNFSRQTKQTARKHNKTLECSQQTNNMHTHTHKRPHTHTNAHISAALWKRRTGFWLSDFCVSIQN